MVIRVCATSRNGNAVARRVGTTNTIQPKGRRFRAIPNRRRSAAEPLPVQPGIATMAPAARGGPSEPRKPIAKADAIAQSRSGAATLAEGCKLIEPDPPWDAILKLAADLLGHIPGPGSGFVTPLVDPHLLNSTPDFLKN